MTDLFHVIEQSVGVIASLKVATSDLETEITFHNSKGNLYEVYL